MDFTPDKSSTGMEPTLAAGLAVLILPGACWIGGLIFFLMEKESKYVKFYAFQALCLGICYFASVLAVIPVVGWIIVPLWDLFLFVIWIICLINAFSGKIFKIPVIGNIAAKQAGME